MRVPYSGSGWSYPSVTRTSSERYVGIVIRGLDVVKVVVARRWFGGVAKLKHAKLERSSEV